MLQRVEHQPAPGDDHAAASLFEVRYWQRAVGLGAAGVVGEVETSVCAYDQLRAEPRRGGELVPSYVVAIVACRGACLLPDTHKFGRYSLALRDGRLHRSIDSEGPRETEDDATGRRAHQYRRAVLLQQHLDLVLFSLFVAVGIEPGDQHVR